MIRFVREVPDPELKDWIGRAARFRPMEDGTIIGIFDGKKYVFKPEMLEELQEDVLFEFFKEQSKKIDQIAKDYDFKRTGVPANQWINVAESNGEECIFASSAEVNAIAFSAMIYILSAYTHEDKEYCAKAVTYMLDAIDNKRIPV